jgi:hypothetical protein
MHPKPELATSGIPKEEWAAFLGEFGDAHEGWLTTLETTDHVTQETAESQDMPLKFIELDLEDEKNPRINVVVRMDNKILKHILFRPSRVVLHAYRDGRESLEVETINTTTRVHVRPQGNSFLVS